ncbi:NPL4 family-domain-containing protein [Dipodascopsis tothii]|uniref:NPL4 family-domain-containing protein n=1 Tax=Dipodascopsis tothii TaxID=44089 RepID=UPI0034CE002B
MIIRLRTKDGQLRASARPEDDFAVVAEELVRQVPDIVADSVVVSDQPGAGGRPLAELLGRTVGELGIGHGDMLFVTYETATGGVATPPAAASAPAAIRLNGKAVPAEALAPTAPAGGAPWETAVQDAVDVTLDQQDGKIVRSRDNKMCKHTAKGMCDYCMPLEPWDPAYLKERGIKHASFHAHLRKLNTAANRPENRASFIPPLSEADYGVTTRCPGGHAPWPEGICSKCQPSAITLQQQPFRMVDHAEFASADVVNDFINHWRRTGNQAIGYLYGRYEPYAEVPLGIKAVIEAIHEPPQVAAPDGVQLTLPWESEADVDAAAAGAGLRRVGVIFTDLTDAGAGDGSVVCRRHVDSYFLSSLEICFAAALQNQHPNPSRWSDTGRFSSKFITCVVSGNPDGQIEISAYQVSNSAEAMVRAGIIEPSVSPELMLVKEPSSTLYVPEVFFTRVNEYKVAVQENAKPVFPVEYLLVTLSHGFPAS